MPVGHAESVFRCRLAQYARDIPATDDDATGGAMSHITTTAGHTLPAVLAPHLDLVAGLSEPFPAAKFLRKSRKLNATGTSGKSPSAALKNGFPCLYDAADPACLKDHYGMTGTDS